MLEVIVPISDAQFSQICGVLEADMRMRGHDSVIISMGCEGPQVDTIFVHGSACDIEAVIIELKNDQFWRECVPFFTEIEPTKLALVVCFDIMTSSRLFTMFHLVSPHKERDRFFCEVLLHELFPRGLKSSKFGKARVTIDIMGASMPKFKNKVETLFAEYIREKVENCLIPTLSLEYKYFES